MAVSQRNFLPFLLLVIGLGLFAIFGFGIGDGKPVSSTNGQNSTLPVRDEAAIDDVARKFVESPHSDDQQSVDSNDQVDSGPSQQPAESQRLNLSGQTVDDKLSKGADDRFDITFDTIKFDIPEGEPYSHSMLTDQIRMLDGQEIKIRGYIRPSFKQRDLKNFVFVRDDKECCFGPGAALFDCVIVKLAKGQKTDYTVRPVAVTGKFSLKEFKAPNGDVWAIYRMKDAAVTK